MKGKYTKHRGVTSKTLIVALAVMLVIGCTIGGTIAWLMDTTETVTNTFTVGKVEITLKESPLNANGTYGTPAEGTQNSYKLIPGETYTKDPTVAVISGSEDCYLFVKFEQNGNASTYITYTSTLNEDNGWTQGDGTNIPSNVWYRTVESDATVRSWELLANNTITINADAVTTDSMENAKNAALVYTAYAVQKDNVATAADAWAKVNPTT